MVVLQITDQTVRILCGPWPNLSACIEKRRSSEEEMAEDIRHVFSQIKGAPASCVLLLSRRETVFKEMVFPSRDEQEILKMIALQVPAVVPYDHEQTVYNYRLIQVMDSGYSATVMAVIPENIIQKYVAAAQTAGAAVSDVYVSADGMDCFLQKAGPTDLGDVPCSVVVSIDARSSEIMFYQQRRWLFSSYLTYGFSNFVDASEEAAQEILRCIEIFEKNHSGLIVEQIWLAADEEQTGALATCLARLRKWKVACLDSCGSLPDPVCALFDSKKINFSWLPLLGCLLKDNQTRFMNFLPKGVYLSKAQKQGRKDVLRFCLALAIAGFFIFLLCWGILYKQAQYVESLERQSAQLDPLMGKMRSESEFLEEISRRSDARYSTVRMVKEIYELLPDDVSIQSLGMRIKGGFDLQGIAIKDQSVNQLQSALVSSAFFSRVDLQYATKRRRFDKEYTEFKIIFYPGT